MQKRFSITIKGAVLSLIVTLMLSVLMSALIFFRDVPEQAETALIFFITALSCMAGAYAGAKALESKGLLTGGAMGIIYYIALLIISVIIKKDFMFDLHMLIMLVTATLSGMLGGVLGMPR